MPPPVTLKLDTTGNQRAEFSTVLNVAGAPVPSVRKVPAGQVRVKRWKMLTVAPGERRLTQICAMVRRWAFWAQTSKVIHRAPSIGEIGGLFCAAAQLSQL